MLQSQKVINALAIRDTSAKTSDVVENGDIFIKTIIVENTLNQAVTFQCQGSSTADFANYFLIGSTWDVSASTNIFATCDSYIPFWRIIATCSVAPASGTLTVIIYGVS